jgi:hypothetical protein
MRRDELRTALFEPADGREARIKVGYIAGGPVAMLLVFMVSVIALFGSIPEHGAFIGLGLFLTQGAVVYRMLHYPRQRAAMAFAAAAATPTPPALPASARWRRAVAQFDALRTEYSAHECDPVQVLRLPALTDVCVPSTERFIDAFAEAQALHTDSRPGTAHAERFATAVDTAARAWTAAKEAARRIRLSGLSPGERARIERVLRLLGTARNSDSEPERLAAYAMARSELARLDRAGVVHVPQPARLALATAGRGELPPSQS